MRRTTIHPPRPPAQHESMEQCRPARRPACGCAGGASRNRWSMIIRAAQFLAFLGLAKLVSPWFLVGAGLIALRSLLAL